jgi:hypothetical protein
VLSKPAQKSGGRITLQSEQRLHSAVSSAANWLKPQQQEPEQERVADRVTTPVRAPTVESDVMVPLLRGVVTAAFFFLSSGGLFVWRGTPAPFALATTCCAVGFWLGWRGGLNLSKDTLHKIEEWLNVDLDGDGHEGKPPPRNVTVTVQDRRGKSMVIKYLEPPLSEEKLEAVAVAVLVQGESFSRPGLCERAGVLTQTEYNTLAAWMEEKELVVKLPNNQRELTDIGRNMLLELMPPLP